MPNLFPTDLGDYEIDEENVLSELNETNVGYKGGIYFDSASNDVLMNGSGQVLPADGTQAWIQWCEKCIATPRFKCKAYSSDFGIDVDEIFNATTRDEAEAIISGEISDALMADQYGRTAYVNSIEYDWESPDSVHVTVEIIGIDGHTATIQGNIKNA